MDNKQIQTNESNYDASYSHKMPIIFDYKRGGGINLSKREKTVADAFLSAKSYEACRRACKAVHYPTPKSSTIKKWLERPHVKEYLAERWKELGYTNGYNAERWKMELIQYKEGIKQANSSTMFCMKLLGMALGVGKTDVVVNNAQQINFTQADGS